MDTSVESDLYACYAVYCYKVDMITQEIDYNVPAYVVALVSSASAADCLVESYNEAMSGLAFRKELDAIQKVGINYTPLPFT